jgi:hypothetical protein
LRTVAMAILSTACAVGAQQADATAMQKLKPLTGSWACTVRGGQSDGLWMTELSQDTRTNGNDWATQMWGYDSHTRKLVAYNFARNGVFTKSVDGWVDGAFVSHRDDNGATVSVRPIDANSVQWVIESADHSYTVKEDCVRR